MLLNLIGHTGVKCPSQAKQSLANRNGIAKLRAAILKLFGLRPTYACKSYR